MQLGTCAMKPREHGGVVDTSLKVYGVEALKVAGKYLLSTFPLLYLLIILEQTSPSRLET